MTDILAKIEKGLVLNSELMLNWNDTQEYIVNLLKKDIQKVNNEYFTLDVSLFDNQFNGKLGIHFSNKGMIKKIELYQEQADNDIHTTFAENQKLLEEYFSKPSKISSGAFAILKADRAAKEYKWHFKSVTIVHSLWDRFDFEEHIEFLVK